VRRLNGLNYDYLKLKKEEVIYRVRFVHKYRVLPLHTACASRASARDHVTWNARTVTVLQGLKKIFVNNPDNKELVTCVEYFSATGYYIPLMLIFKGVYYL
jgi:hypothetical protein